MFAFRRRHRGHVFGKTCQLTVSECVFIEVGVNVDVDLRKNFSRIVVDHTLV